MCFSILFTAMPAQSSSNKNIFFQFLLPIFVVARVYSFFPLDVLTQSFPFLSPYFSISIHFFFISVPIHLSFHLPIQVSTFLCSYLGIYLTMFLSRYLPFYVPIQASTFLRSYLGIYLSMFLSRYLPYNVPIYLSFNSSLPPTSNVLLFLSSRSSVTRLGEFWNSLVTNFITKVAQMFDDFLGSCENHHFFKSNW